MYGKVPISTTVSWRDQIYTQETGEETGRQAGRQEVHRLKDMKAGSKHRKRVGENEVGKGEIILYPMTKYSLRRHTYVPTY